jgi:energy-coupling factor transport system ATP-binding protein
MIEFDRVSVTYPDAARPALREVNLTIAEGELCLVAGHTGAGKTTLLRAVNGLVPHFTGGRLAGRVTVAGHDTRTTPPRELAHLVGVVGQDPQAGFTTDTVEEELVYGMEQLAVAPAVMRRRVEETLDLLGMADLRNRPLRTLSGGQQQRVAIGSVLTAHPAVLVLDEPTSALDPTAAEDVLATITRLVHDLGVTVLVAEHRLERVVHFADRLVYLPGDGTVQYGRPEELLATTAIAPPVVHLGRLAGWDPLPLSVRAARRRAAGLRARLAGQAPQSGSPAVGEPVAQARRLVVRYGAIPALCGVDLALFRGQVLAVMGRNGSGKSSLLWAIQGSGPRHGGTLQVAGADPASRPAAAARAVVGLVPQTPTDLLYLDSVDAECRQADREAQAPAGSCRALLDRLVPGIDGGTHPRDLSEGERLALVLSIQMVAAPVVVLLDEPTRGLDYPAKRHLARLVQDLAAAGRCVAIATHDVEFVAQAADRVVVLADGEIVADGPTAEVVVGSPAFAPQVAKVLAPEPAANGGAAVWLTTSQVAEALQGKPA